MEAKETFTCEEIKEDVINSFKIAFCFGLFSQLARFRYQGVAVKTYNEVMKIIRTSNNLTQITELMSNKRSVAEICKQLEFSYILTKNEFIEFISKITRKTEISEIQTNLVTTLKVAIKEIFYEEEGQSSKNYTSDIQNGNTIMISLYRKYENNRPANYYKTQSSYEALLDNDYDKYKERLIFYPFTFNPRVNETSYNLKTVIIEMIKALDKQVDYIPIRKLESATASIGDLGDSKLNALLKHDYLECVHSNNENIMMECCKAERCIQCLKEKRQLISRSICLCGQNISKAKEQEIEMETEIGLKSQIASTYHRTLELAKGITKNRYQFFDEEISKEHTRFIKNISRCCREYKDLSSKYNKKDETTENSEQHLETNNDYIAKPHFGYGKDSGKLKMGNLVHESYKMAKKTRTGKGGIRYLTPSPPPVLRKLRNNKSVYSESSDSEDKPLAYISLINGKTEQIELPSFKECIKGNRRIDSDSEMVLTKIDKCHEKISNFEKRMNGLEVFCKYNPGVKWNNDKKLLMKLSSNQYNRNALIKAYNERKPSSTVSSKRFSVFGKGRIKLPEKTNGVVMPVIEEKGINTEGEWSRSELLQEHCFDGFHQAKLAANSKTLQILSKLQAERPSYLRAKAELIIADDEIYKGKIHSFQKFDSIKKTVEKERYSFVEKCKEQVKVYTRILDYLKKYKGMPSMQMIGFAEAVKELIQGGWTLTRENVEGVLAVFNEDEMEDLNPMKEIVEEYLIEMGL